MKNKNLILQKVHYIPENFDPGVFYYSEVYAIAGHLCPCGCGNKVITPIDADHWSYTQTDGKPTLYPCLENHHLPCNSTYWLIFGEVLWSNRAPYDDKPKARKTENEERKLYL
jgi:hypothetical protein